MKKHLMVSVMIIFLVTMFSCMTTAQETPSNQIFWVASLKVIPLKLQEYRAAYQDWLKLLKENKFSTPISISVGSDSTCNFLLGFPDFAAMDKAYAEYSAIMQKENAKAIDKRMGDTTNGEDVWLAMYRPDLSYVPEKPRLKPEEAPFGRCTFYYIMPGTADKMEQLCTRVVDLYKKHNITRGFNVSAAITGENLPFYVVCDAAGGKNAADYFTESAKINEALSGAELQAITTEIGSITRDFNVLNFTSRPDLAYTPE